MLLRLPRYNDGREFRMYCSSLAPVPKARIWPNSSCPSPQVGAWTPKLPAPSPNWYCGIVYLKLSFQSRLLRRPGKARKIQGLSKTGTGNVPVPVLRFAAPIFFIVFIIYLLHRPKWVTVPYMSPLYVHICPRNYS